MKQTHTKPRETLDFGITKPRKTFHFNPANQIKEDWMIGLTMVYNHIFNKTEEKNKLKLYNFPDGKSVSVSYEKAINEFERNLDVSDITATGL